MLNLGDTLIGQPFEPRAHFGGGADEGGDAQGAAGDDLSVDVVQLGQVPGVQMEVALTSGTASASSRKRPALGNPSMRASPCSRNA